MSGTTYSAYERDRALRWAVERGVEIIGEAARGGAEGVSGTASEIPWRLIIAQRHVIAHDYGEILNERIWRVASIHVPVLLGQIEALLPPE